MFEVKIYYNNSLDFFYHESKAIETTNTGRLKAIEKAMQIFEHNQIGNFDDYKIVTTIKVFLNEERF